MNALATSMRVASESRSARVAVVGAGYFSQFHLRGWQRVGAEIVGLCDLNTNRANQLASKFGILRTYAKFSEMLAREDCDLVDIAVPPAHHFEIASTAIEMGLPIICQKPFTTSYAQAEKLVQIAKRRDVPIIIHENFRFMPWYREAKRLIERNQFGKLHSITFRLRPGDGQGADAYLDRQPYFQTMHRFLVAETAIHFIDTFRYLFGEIESVTARLRRVNPHIAGEDAGVVIFEFESGAVGVLDANRCNDHSASNLRRTMGEMWIEGERGSLRLDGEARLWWKPHGSFESEHRYDAGSADPADFGGGACTALQRSALSALFERGEPENLADEYLANMRVQEAIYQSHETEHRIGLGDFSPPIDPLIPTL